MLKGIYALLGKGMIIPLNLDNFKKLKYVETDKIIGVYVGSN